MKERLSVVFWVGDAFAAQAQHFCSERASNFLRKERGFRDDSR